MIEPNSQNTPDFKEDKKESPFFKKSDDNQKQTEPEVRVEEVDQPLKNKLEDKIEIT